MKKNKINFVIYCLLFLPMLNGCIQSSASLFGPAITVAKTGNIYQAGFSYASNNVIKKEFGKSPTEYVRGVLNKNSYTSELVFIASEKKNIEDTKFSLISENSNNNYEEFLGAVKKMLE
jgi:hypothetical protein